MNYIFYLILRNLFACFFACIISSQVIAADIKDISFELGGWTYTSAAVYNSVTKELTIKGNSGTYEYARYTINLPAGTTNIYLSAEVYLENIVTGALTYQCPKFKISQVSGVVINVKNFSSPAEGSWFNTFLQANATGITQVILEFGFQNSTGTFIIKNPKITNTTPIPTPYSFPYTVPTNPICSLDLLTVDTMKFNNDLLSTNSHFSWASKSWGDPEVVNAINKYFRMSNYRFPGGTVGNFYNWTTDGYYGNSYTFANPNLTNLYNNGFKFGYPGYKNLLLSTSGSATLMFNVLTDDITISKNRLQSRLSDGLDVKWVELGNENFYSNQSYGNVAGGQWQVSDVDAYISFTSTLATELKKISPTTKFTVCIDQHDFSLGGWSNKLSTQTYYDATTIHNYNNVGSVNLDFLSGVVLFDSYRKTRKYIKNYKIHFGNTPTIFTEWGVLGSNSFLSVLSAADMFMAILEGNTSDGVVMQAGIHMLYHSDANVPQTLMLMDGGTVKYSPMGAFYAKLYDVFKDRKIYKALSVSDNIDTDLPGVISRAVIVNDSIRIFSVNKLPVASKLQLSLDNKPITGYYRIETYSMSPEIWPNAYTNPNDPWSLSFQFGDIMLPAYSLSVVTISKNNPLPITLLDFSGSKQNNTIELNWSTSIEKNNEKFVIERSEDGIHFQEIGNVKGVGNSATIHNYNFTDINPINGANYYRLKQIDLDGSYSFSNTIHLDNRSTADMIVYPNPNNGSFSIKVYNASNEYKLELTNILGNVIYTRDGTADVEITTVTDLKSGVYIVRLFSGGEIITKKLEVI